MQKICGFFCWESQVPASLEPKIKQKMEYLIRHKQVRRFLIEYRPNDFFLFGAPLPSGPEAEVPLPVRLPRGLPLAPGPLYRHRTAAGFPLLPQGGRQVFHLSVLGGLGAKLHPRLRPRRL